ncbi:hypothetical protein [Tomitella cavernea]|nr:hypothetical protein [Tomitella cavernea]
MYTTWQPVANADNTTTAQAIGHRRHEGDGNEAVARVRTNE